MTDAGDASYHDFLAEIEDDLTAAHGASVSVSLLLSFCLGILDQAEVVALGSALMARARERWPERNADGYRALDEACIAFAGGRPMREEFADLLPEPQFPFLRPPEDHHPPSHPDHPHRQEPRMTPLGQFLTNRINEDRTRAEHHQALYRENDGDRLVTVKCKNHLHRLHGPALEAMHDYSRVRLIDCVIWQGLVDATQDERLNADAAIGLVYACRLLAMRWETHPDWAEEWRLEL